jgi:hypothetical protein
VFSWAILCSASSERSACAKGRTIADADRIIAAERETGLTVGVISQRRFVSHWGPSANETWLAHLPQV